MFQHLQGQITATFSGLFAASTSYLYTFRLKKIGHISLHREIFNWDLYFAEPFTKAQAWIDLLLLANHTDGQVFIRGICVPIKRGQVGWSDQKLSRRWDWSDGKVKRFLNMLEMRQQIRQSSCFTLNVKTIVNYDKWQTNEAANEETNEEQTRSKRGANEARTIMKNNENNENNEINFLSTENNVRATEISSSSKKRLHLEFVLLAEDEYTKLIEFMGESNVVEYIGRLNDYLGQTGKRYKSHYHAIRSWYNRDIVEGKIRKFVKPTAPVASLEYRY